MKLMVTITAIGVMAGGALSLSGCSPRVRVDPIRVEPIHITHDVNIRRVDERLDDFFAFQEQQAATTRAATQPATQTVSAGGVTP